MYTGARSRHERSIIIYPDWVGPNRNIYRLVVFSLMLWLLITSFNRRHCNWIDRCDHHHHHFVYEFALVVGNSSQKACVSLHVGLSLSLPFPFLPYCPLSHSLLWSKKRARLLAIGKNWLEMGIGSNSSTLITYGRYWLTQIICVGFVSFMASFCFSFFFFLFRLLFIYISLLKEKNVLVFVFNRIELSWISFCALI